MSGRRGFPEPVEGLITELQRLPGVGRRSAERMAFHLLRSSAEDALGLARAIETVKRDVAPCGICGNLSHEQPCSICRDDERDASIVLVVEQTRDLLSLEETGAFGGVYHVLGGRIDALAGKGPETIDVEGLLRRAEDPAANSRGVPVVEIVLGLSPDLEGDGTALYLADRLGGLGRTDGDGRDGGVRLSRLARGLPAGSQLEYASPAVLADAIRERRGVDV